MNNKPVSAMPAIAAPQDSLSILRDVSDIYERIADVRKSAARVAHDGGHTYQQLGEALGMTRSGAYNLVNRDAA
ncbi:hypothetical protein PV761_03390 [Arthrobacter sp. CC3]|uniref:hypothetical protein n=1 Tax=Arthrobacter sp. CC3 TaxID=3029185 RepID=UPI003264E063